MTTPPLTRLTPVGRVFFATAVAFFGVQHFLWLDDVTPLVPAWIPGAVFWTEFAGVALIAGWAGCCSPRWRDSPRCSPAQCSFSG